MLTKKHTFLFLKLPQKRVLFLTICLVTSILLLIFCFTWILMRAFALENENTKDSHQLYVMTKSYIAVKHEKQYLQNQHLQNVILHMQSTFTTSIQDYQAMSDLRSQNQNTNQLDSLFTQALHFLSQTNYASASTTLKVLGQAIQISEIKFSQSQQPATSAQTITSNNPPTSGFQIQQVHTSSGIFFVDIIAADLHSTRVIADTASSSNCITNCPVMDLSNYISRNNGFAGINGTFFCPADYPSCASKTNSYDTLLMNKNKTYFNSANNVYSTVPAIIVSGTNVRVVPESLQWGRDTSPDMVLAMQPLLILNHQIVYNNNNDPKYTSNGDRGFIGNIGSTIYIGDVLNATMQDSATVLHTLNLDNALNLDEGGSTALWYEGYQLGPGRNIPNAVIFVRR